MTSWAVHLLQNNINQTKVRKYSILTIHQNNGEALAFCNLAVVPLLVGHDPYQGKDSHL